VLLSRALGCRGKNGARGRAFIALPKAIRHDVTDAQLLRRIAHFPRRKHAIRLTKARQHASTQADVHAINWLLQKLLPTLPLHGIKQGRLDTVKPQPLGFQITRMMRQMVIQPVT
jgi:hypothetical protein